jgi:O-antigen/teichoic acid export membrane protein
MTAEPKQNSLTSALSWKLLERFGVSGAQFVLQVILARLLAPELYGVLSIMIIFTTLANVFIHNGFNSSLVQNRHVTEEDYSSVFWVSLGVAAALYGLIFVGAPFIGVFYEMPDIVLPLRVLALMLFPGVLNSVQLAKVSREMQFRKVFSSSLAGVLVSGVAGIAIAYAGGGLWALVAQTMLNVTTTCIVMCFTVKLRIRFVCNLRRVRLLLSFGWKLLVSSLLDTLYQDLRSLVIGKKYDSGTLGYYNRGKQFPQFIISAVGNTVQSVMLPAMSQKQDNRAALKDLTRQSIVMSSYVLFPIMAGLAGVSAPLVQLLLTDKWLPCVPYMQIYCFALAFNPIHMCNLQAINAMGRSDIFLTLEMIKKTIGVGALLVAVFCFQTPIAIALTGAFTALISCFINAYPNKKLIGYSYFEQMKDMLPSLVAAAAMLVAVLAVQQLGLGALLTLLVQIPVGVVVYGGISALFRLQPFCMLVDGLRQKLRARTQKGDK